MPVLQSVSRRWRLAGLIVCTVALVCAGAAVLLLGAPGQAQQSAQIGGPFTLEDGSGSTVTNKTFRGKYMLVYFGYTYCPDVCPTTLNDLAEALDKLGSRADKVQPLFVTVDPARDTPAVIQRYTAAFSNRIEGLTGTAAQIKAVAEEYRVYYAKHITGPNAGDYTMDHSSIIYVMAPSGQFKGVIRANEGSAAMAADIEKYLA